VLGTVGGVDNGAAWTGGWVGYNTTTTVILYAKNSTTYQYGTVTATAPFTIADGDRFNWQFKVPIVGWSSNTTMADRAVESYGSTSGTWDADSSTTVLGPQGTQIGGALTAVRNKTITWDTPIQSTDRFVVELSEDQIQWHDADGFSNNSSSFICSTTLSSTGSFTTSAGVFVAKATSANQTRVTFCRYSSMANDDTPTGDWATGIYWRVRKVSAGAQVGYPISPNNLVKSLVRYRTGAGQSISNATFTIIDFGTKDFDTKNEVTTGASWKFTAAQTGYYRVNSAITFTSTTAWAEGEVIELNLYKNGSSVSCMGRTNGRDFSASSEYASAAGGDIIYLLAGDYIDFRLYQNSGGTLALLNNSAFNHVSIEQIG
jgi:hypothetical protein